MEMILNSESLLRRVGDDEELVNELLQLFIDTIPEIIVDLNLAIDRKKSDLIKLKAHALKGSAGNISAEKLAKTAERIELLGKENNIPGSAALLPKLIEDYDELESTIVQLIKNTKSE